MKLSKLFALALSSAALLACTREAAEISPEALKAYGVPSQSSNFDSSEKKKEKPDNHVSWVDSSAIVKKSRIDY